MATMRATVFHGMNNISVEEIPRPCAGVGEAVLRITLTTICGTDLHILRGEYPVKPGLVIGHEPVGVITELGPGITGYAVGDRVLVGAITPCGQCQACLSGHLSQCGHGSGYQALGGWRFGNTINGAQAEYLLVPNAQANLAKIPEELTDEQVVLLADIASTGFSGAESGGVKIGDAVVVFAQGPIGLCATAGAKLMGAALVIGVDGDEARLKMAQRMGADVVLDYRAVDVVEEVKRLTDGGADVAIEALGTQQTFEQALRCLRPGGTLSSLGVYAGKLHIPYDAFAA
ncbi:MAG TPA: alcohol dehydrogenase catalytic domain-containing protein, partial [Candidatus Tectomicrobia bacterium]